jgi:hypothetical protein
MVSITSTRLRALRIATAPDSNRKIIEELKKYALEHEARYGRFPKTLIFAANGHAAEMACIALVSFTHTRTPLQAACSMDRQAADMDCIALVSFTHTRTPPPGSRTHSRDHGRPILRNGKPAAKIARQPRLAILKASLPSACASNSSMSNQLPRRPAKPLGPLTALPVLSANSATPWRTVKRFADKDLTDLSAKPPRETTFSEIRKIVQNWGDQSVAQFGKLALGQDADRIESYSVVASPGIQLKR